MLRRLFTAILIIAAIILFASLIGASSPASAHTVPCTHGSKQVGAHGKTEWVRAENRRNSNGNWKHYHIQKWKPVRGGVTAHTDRILCGEFAFPPWNNNDIHWFWHSGLSGLALESNPSSR